MIGHLLNPRVGGQSMREVRAMRWREATAALRCIGASNAAIEAARE